MNTGELVGPYRVLEKLGEGGMGEVYRARDTRLDRDVALKVLPDSFASDRDRLMRFEREAKTLAALNHPHIAQIHGVEDAGAARALVMELVEGEDLAQRIARGPIPLDEGLPIARQIAEALEAAHEAGVIHRDLKPANIKVRPDGTVKVLDFGLAKPGHPAHSAPRDATVTSPAMTMQGVILGTAAYMAPEQAKGRPVDRRVDIWAFGCVLYEMLSGAAPFQGDSITDILAAVVKTEPDWRALPADTPPRIRQLLWRCLQKEPRLRLRDIGDARLELDAAGEEPFAPTAATGRREYRQWRVVAAVLGVISLTLAALLAGASTRSSDAPRVPAHLSVTFPADAQMHLSLSRPSLAISPNGRRIVYTAAYGDRGPHLWVRDLDQFEPRAIAGTRDARMAVFSPDGRWLAFFADGKLKKIPLTAGPAVELADAAGASGAAWTSKDEIVFALGISAPPDEAGLWRVAASGGDRRRVAAGSLWFPDALPGGDAVLVTTPRPGAATSGDLTIAAVDLESGRVTRLFDGGTYARYAPTGHLIYLRNGDLLAATFDATTLTVGEERVTVATGAYSDPSLAAGNHALSPSGTLAYVPGDGSHFQRTLTVVNGSSRRPLIEERQYYEWARLSPDGGRVAVMRRAWVDAIYAIDLARGTSTPLTSGAFSAVSPPLWSPDGRRVIVSLWRRDGSYHLVSLASDGSGSEELLRASESRQYPLSFTPDAKTLIFRERQPETGDDLLMLTMADRAVRPLLATPSDESGAAVSPDGRWIAFQSNRSGQMQVHLASFPDLKGVVQVSTAGGSMPVWSRDGRRLYYNRRTFAADVEVVDIGAGTPPRLSRPQSVSQFSSADGAFDLMPDGSLLFVSGSGNDGSTPELRVVVNVFDKLQRRTAGAPE